MSPTIRHRQDPETDPARFHEDFADEFDGAMNEYEVRKRLDLVFGRLLSEPQLRGSTMLDAGCGTGGFSSAAASRGARVTSLDVGDRLLAKVAQKCDSERVVGDLMALPFQDRLIRHRALDRGY